MSGSNQGATSSGLMARLFFYLEIAPAGAAGATGAKPLNLSDSAISTETKITVLTESSRCFNSVLPPLQLLFMHQFCCVH